MTEENKEDSNEENCPLTPSDWVMFLSGDINALYSMFGTFLAISMAAIALLVATSSAISNADNTIDVSNIIILVLFTTIVVGVGVVVYTDKTIKKFKNVRNDIIYEELTGYNEIRKQCEKAGVFWKKPKNKIK